MNSTEVDLSSKVLRVLEVINKMHVDQLVSEGLSEEQSAEICGIIDEVGGITSLDDLRHTIGSENSEVIQAIAEKLIEKKVRKKIEAKADKVLRKTLNRMQYVPRPRFLHDKIRTGPNEGKRRFRFETELACYGTLDWISQKNGWGPLPSIQLQTLLDHGRSRQEQQEDPAWTELERDALWENGLAFSQGNLGWNMKHPAFKLLTNCFSDAIHATAYSHSLQSPCLPEGFFPDLKCRMRDLTELYGADGSHRAHPDSIIWKQLGLEPRVIQIRAIDSEGKGIFVKGILVPDETCLSEEGEPEVWFDWNSVKGEFKDWAAGKAKLGVEEFINFDMGAINKWDRPGKIRAGFEWLENLDTSDRAKELVASLAEETWSKFDSGDKAYHKLIRIATEDDAELQMLVKTVDVLKEHSPTLSHMQVKRIQNAVKEKLRWTLAHFMTGAGVVFNRYVIVHDKNVARGTVVMGGYRIGSEVASFRYPVVLSQGLQALTIVEPLEHHKIGGKIVPFAAFVNPEDMKNLFIGDDDGDFNGFTNDVRIVELHKNHVIPSNLSVEPAGIKRKIPIMNSDGTVSVEAKEYMSHDPRGPVGLPTLWRSSLLAIGDVDGANAVSWLIQEFIDMAKRTVEFTDFRLAADPKNHVLLDNGMKGFFKKLNTRVYVPGAFATLTAVVKLAQKWVEQRIIKAGFTADAKTAFYTIGWRATRDEADIDKWPEVAWPYEKPGGNLIHFVYDLMMAKWNSVKHRFKFDAPDSELGPVLQQAMLQKGVSVEIELPTWQDYQAGLRVKSGLVKFASEWSKMASKGFSTDDRNNNLVFMNQELDTALGRLNLKDIVTIWRMECESEHGNAVHAFRAITFAHSPIIKILGIDEVEHCSFLDDENVVKKTIELSLAHPTPANRLYELMTTSTGHSRAIKDDEGNPVHIINCKVCCEALTNRLLANVRERYTVTSKAAVIATLEPLNKYMLSAQAEQEEDPWIAAP